MSLQKKIAIASGGIVVLSLAVLFWPQEPLEWHLESEYRWAELTISSSGQPGFSLLPPSETGITFTNTLKPEQIAANRFLLGGSGLATGDVDGDGLADIYFCGLDTNNVLYRNLGDWRFEDITRAAGVACPDRFSTGATFADIDGDSDLDLLVTALGGPNSCFLNDGTGRFQEVTESAGLSSKKGSTSMALADIEGDGDLDLYLTNFKKISVESLYPPHKLRPRNVTRKIGDSFVVVPEFREHYRVEVIGGQPILFENAEPDILYINDGNGNFQPMSFSDGRFTNETGQPVKELPDWGLQPRFQDMDNDGDPDIYVCNDYNSPDRIWINDGTGRFQLVDPLAIRHTSKFTMAVDFSDINRDGYDDFMLIDMLAQDHKRRMQQMGTNPQLLPTIIGKYDDRPQIKRNTLFVNRGDNSYAEIGQLSGVQASEWTWSIRFFDVDLDGYEDILATNGQLHDFEDADTNNRVQRLAMLGHDYRKLTMLYPEYLTPNVAFRNQGDLTFQDVSAEWGFTEPDLAWGMASADFDLDGDLDLATNRFQNPAGIYRNTVTAPRIAVRLRGNPPNTQGIGARIQVEGGPVPQSKEVVCGGSYLSGSDPIATFAAKSPESPLNIKVTWRDGKTSEIPDVLPNRLYEIFEPDIAGDRSGAAPDSAAKPFFEDVGHLISHTHHEEPFDDFQRQPLLPYRLSQPGPGLAWYDIDGDSRDDLIITSGRGGRLVAYLNRGRNGFSLLESQEFSRTSKHDQTAVVGLSGAKGGRSLLVAHSNYEAAESVDSFVERYDRKAGAWVHANTIPNGSSSIGPMCLADYDGDTDLDLFIGGRTVPGRYPEPASSRMYTNENGEFKLDQRNSAGLDSLGLVSGAVFSDYDGDGDADLILAIEWGPVTILRNEKGSFKNVTAELGLSEQIGWWNGVTTGDLNEDGRLDLVATNWGKNHSRHSAADSLRIYYGDFDGNGTLDLIQAYYDPGMKKIVPERGLTALMKAIPYVRPRAPTNTKYAELSVSEILGESLAHAEKLTANTLEHMVFLNRGNGFEATPLPTEAQFAPAFYAGVADFDGDGHEDVFLSQNFFATNPDVERYDAGRALWLRGDGTGQLRAVPGHLSGVMVYGEQRGAALGDYDNDGRIDLAVSQNGAATKLFHNILGKPGLRVYLAGPTSNPFGVGAVIRMVYDQDLGPAREVHAGSGYLSQDSPIQIMGLRKQPTAVWVRWPGGKETQVPIAGDPSQITISFQNAENKRSTP